MIQVIEEKGDSPRIGFVAKGGMLFFNCIQAYLGIGEWVEERE